MLVLRSLRFSPDLKRTCYAPPPLLIGAIPLHLAYPKSTSERGKKNLPPSPIRPSGTTPSAGWWRGRRAAFRCARSDTTWSRWSAARWSAPRAVDRAVLGPNKSLLALPEKTKTRSKDTVTAVLFFNNIPIFHVPMGKFTFEEKGPCIE